MASTGASLIVTPAAASRTRRFVASQGLPDRGGGGTTGPKADRIGDEGWDVCEDISGRARSSRKQRRPVTGEENKRVYERHIELLIAQEFGALDEVVDPGRYREICVGFTTGWVNLSEAVAPLEKVVVGIPDLNARIDDVVYEGNKVYARLTVTGTNTGRFFGAPPTGRAYEASMFDYARIEDGRIVERIQQSDTLSQITQMYRGRLAKEAGLAAGAGLLGAALLVLGRRRRGRW